MQEYNFQIIHRPGKSNLVADALSRRDYQGEISTSEINSVAIQDNDSIETQDSNPAVPLSKLSKSASTQTSHYDAENTGYQVLSINTCTIDQSTFTVDSLGIQTDELEEQVSEFTSIIVHCVEETPKVMTVVPVSTETKSEVESVLQETEEPEDDKMNIEDNCCIQVSFSYNHESPIVAPVQTESDDEDDRQVFFNNLGKLQADCLDFKHVYQYLHDGTPEEANAKDLIFAEAKHFSLVDGILYHWFQRRCKKPKGDFNFIRQLALPQVLRRDALLSYHDSLAGGGHLGDM